MSEATEIGGQVPSNGGVQAIEFTVPYMADATIQGTADLLFHRWNCESVETKSKAAKNSRAKKTDDLESYVYRTEEGQLALPGEYVRQAIIHAAKFRQDPRSPRKSAMDLFKAGVVALTALAPLGTNRWDYEDRRRVVIQRNGITRTRPAMKVGWKAEVSFLVTLPEYIQPEVLNEVLSMAGRIIGVGDYRPTYGRFILTVFEVRSES